ncbi:MBL fold metallo-hydrolase [Salinicoccus hispanicus]|uniref:MBL fold metallo-hydrolase n=1 Tax=Salinicoccus hispanicus TaxID=157225 RepID=A0A6N8U210_9STAP|nr:MBL fold metallo-hydrolase [Salinicoccus hispanicus]MXQ52140.1 MBL fold metallo-hydrolase [Salinicoccus hispanicus]
MLISNAKNLHQLSFMPRLFPVNCYLVEEDDSLTLIDSAMPFCHNKILLTASKIGKPITRLILTHAHSDHVGSLDAMKAALPELSVYISDRDAQLLAGNMTLLPDEPNQPIRGGVPKGIRTRPDILLMEGDRIGSLEVVCSPGHTPGSISLFDLRNGNLVAGDAMQTKGGIAVSGVMKPLFPFPALATWHKELALESAQKLCALNPALLAVGHGKMLEDPKAQMDKAIEEAKQQIK